MRFLADENVPLPSIQAARAAGLDVAAVAEDLPGASDTVVLERARTDERLLLTFDRDFGELVFRFGAVGCPGVIYFRLVPRTPSEVGDLLVQLIGEATLRFEEYFTIIDRDGVRQRRLPARRAD